MVIRNYVEFILSFCNIVKGQANCKHFWTVLDTVLPPNSLSSQIHGFITIFEKKFKFMDLQEKAPSQFTVFLQ